MQLDRAPDLVPNGPPGLRVERVGMDRFDEVRDLNEAVFGEGRVIYRLDRTDLTFLLASVGDRAVGYKVGYAETATTFYSAKGGVLDRWRRTGVARALLVRMEDEARGMGYARFAYDTFPNKHPGMTVLGLAAGYTVAAAGYNAAYRDVRLRFERDL
ncbi:GNAT family N-acetyltransferase [Rubrivirga sp. S365]|uniref:GNAT family N-acetyltransferase n=1 Tax=Rubrivirga sp. S365 TaxID=3076080 RepID=UPI0028C9E842|nr:GNAT family N-acetyltransferase [Rubrivirga sp. S365]MDT7857042.1 GNAT family N-acetyltransferase [Rubrivirga sp. S365]